MLAWSFAARTMDEISALVRALGRHRYVRESEFALHFSVVEALHDLPPFQELAERHRGRLAREPNLDLTSRDPSLWYPVSVDVVLAALSAFWSAGDASDDAKLRLLNRFEHLDLLMPSHEPFASNPEDPPHPELVWLEWELLPICDLDPDRHRGAVEALEQSGEEVDMTAPVYQEALAISVVELCSGARNGVLADDFLIWSDGPYSYADYVFRGVARSAKLSEAPMGIRDIDGSPE
jgi:hypothetical protein